MFEIALTILGALAALLFFLTPRKGSMAEASARARADEAAFSKTPEGIELERYGDEYVDTYRIRYANGKCLYSIDPKRFEGMQGGYEIFKSLMRRRWTLEWDEYLEREKRWEVTQTPGAAGASPPVLPASPSPADKQS